MTQFTSEQVARDAAEIIVAYLPEWEAAAGEQAQVVQWPIEDAILTAKITEVIQESIDMHIADLLESARNSGSA